METPDLLRYFVMGGEIVGTDNASFDPELQQSQADSQVMCSCPHSATMAMQCAGCIALALCVHDPHCLQALLQSALATFLAEKAEGGPVGKLTLKSMAFDDNESPAMGLMNALGR